MEYLNIEDEHINFFNDLINKYKASTEFPEKDNWKKSSNNYLWDMMIIQVMVVGGSNGADRYNQRPHLKQIVQYDTLAKNDNLDDVKQKINYVLREAGVRYASKDLDKCGKTKALVHNFKILKRTKNGFKGILERISEFKGANSDIRKVKYLMKIFNYVKSKSARDFLMERGICTNTLAIDIRIQNIFEKVNLMIPNTILNNPKMYDQVEKEIIANICNPLQIEPVKFDRILYQNYKRITSETI